MPPTAPRHRFRVHAAHGAGGHVRTLEEVSFEAAAVAYLEDLHEAHDDEIRVIVLDIDTGHEHCFRIDLRPCDAATARNPA